MAGKTVSVIIDDTGDATIEAFGFQGRGCSAITQALAQALGTIKEDRFKREYHNAEQCNVRTVIR